MYLSFKQVFFCCFVLLKSVSCIPQTYQGSDFSGIIVETEQDFNWLEAKHECARSDAQLIQIDSKEKNAAIIDILKYQVGGTHNLWLGGNDENSLLQDLNRPFIWSATGKPFSFANWSRGNPDNYMQSEHCVHIWNNNGLYEWNDNKCPVKMGYICETNNYLSY